MKPIVMTKEAETELMKKVAQKLAKEIESFKFNINESKFEFSFNMTQEAKEKVTVLFTPRAYLRMQALVDFYDTEVSWYGLVEKLDSRLYRVYDVKICKQYVTGTKVDTEDEDTLEFFNSLTDDEAEHMHFQAHSHVKMSTTASGTDLQNQADVVHNMGKTGFYIFQIWNKSNDINTYIYDLDENVFYDHKDVLIEIEDDEGVISEFIDSTLDLVCERKTYPYAQKKKDEKDAYTPSYLPGYYEGYQGAWDY